MDSLYRSRLDRRLGKETAHFISSVREDERIFEEDIDGTEAHNIMLYEQGLITREDLKGILNALEMLRSEKRGGEIEVGSEFEDVHEFIEAYVVKKAGIEVGGKLHSGRSRNDQVAVDIRMRLRSCLNEVSKGGLDLIESLLEVAQEHVESLMVLYTHTQHAQIGVFSHYLLAYVDRVLRDLQRLQDCYDRVNLSPLGAGPIGGSSLELDRFRTASLLGFDGLMENSIDAVGSRDFALEVASSLAILMSGLSRIAEDFIAWSSAEFGYLELADEYSSASSIMPQKKNPCTLELIRGKTGRVYGALIALLTMVKGLPTGYNRDLQETKPPLWESTDAVKASLRVLTGAVSTVKVDKRRMLEVASESYVVAVGLAELLVQEADLSFREAHKLVGKLVNEASSSGIKPKGLRAKMLEELSQRVLGKRISVSDDLVKRAVDPWSCLFGRKTRGSPFPKEVKRMTEDRKRVATDRRARLKSRTESLEEAKRALSKTVKTYLLE